MLCAETRRKSRRFWRTSTDFERSERQSRLAASEGIVMKSPPGTELSLSGNRLLSEQMRGDFAEVPDNPQPRHDLQGVVSNVNLPPEEALTRRSHEVVMIVVPAFSECEQGEEPIVAAGISGFVAARTEEVRERIDGERVMPQQHGAQAEAPNE